MGKYVNGWRPGQSVKIELVPPTQDEMRLARQAYQIDNLRNRVKGQEATIRRLKSQLKKLKDPLIAAMTVAQEADGH